MTTALRILAYMARKIGIWAWKAADYIEDRPAVRWGVFLSLLGFLGGLYRAPEHP